MSRMSRVARIIIILSGAAVASQAFILYIATGSRALTRFPSADLAAMHEQQGSLNSLFDNGGSAAAPALIPNEFAFGLLPSPALSPEALSVTTIAGPAILAMLAAFIPDRRPNRSTTKETAP